jgi:hypothetical protein
LSATSFIYKHYLWPITGFVSIIIRRVALVEQELLTLLEHMSSHTVFSGVRVFRSLVLCAMILWIVVCPFRHWVDCSLILITHLVSSNSSSLTCIYILGSYFCTNATYSLLKLNRLLKALSSITDMSL